MPCSIALLAGLSVATLLQASHLAAQTSAIQPIPIRDVEIRNGFWSSRLEKIRAVSLPHILCENEETGRVANFERAAGLAPGSYEGRRFNDTDVYKAIEAAANTLAWHADPDLQSRVARLVDLVASSQEPDGYLFPARTIDPLHPAPGVGAERWIYLNGSHELYNSGHLIEAAVAEFEATGNRALLDVARRNADLLRATFGPTGRKATSGHEEIELALVRLFRATGDRGDLDLARFFLEERGRRHETSDYPADGPFAMYNDRAYRQDQEPVVDQREATGHAVRAMYLYSAMADIASIENDATYRAAVERLWRDVVGRRLYLTGGVGSRDGTESFGAPYELPNATAYTETCASAGNIFWNERMFLLTGQAKYLDVLERVLYNGLLSGVSVAGDSFFYQNPLASAGDVERSSYFEVACCPANLARLLAGLPGLIYAQRDSTVFVDIYADSRARLSVSGVPVTMEQSTRYPWDGTIRLRVIPDRPVSVTLALRVPGWAEGKPVPRSLYRYAGRTGARPSLFVNGRPTRLSQVDGFAVITRTFRGTDDIELRLPMPVRRVVADPRVADDRGRAALERGPLVYCFEQIDNGTSGRIVLDAGHRWQARFRPDLLDGVVGLTDGAGHRAVPYFSWNNRGRGTMDVWLPAGSPR